MCAREWFGRTAEHRIAALGERRIRRNEPAAVQHALDAGLDVVRSDGNSPALEMTAEDGSDHGWRCRKSCQEIRQHERLSHPRIDPGLRGVAIVDVFFED
jgi:hypothetical protein